MISRWQWLLRRLTHKLWFRAALLSVLGVVTALVAIVAAPLIPQQLSAQIGANAVDSILEILASSMLVVTSFSVTTMVSAYSVATNNATPRATRLLIEEPTSQNALSTFIGSFLYSLVGIIALSTGIYGNRGRVVLFVVTIGVILLIVVALIRWIDHLARLGRVEEATNKVEHAAAEAIESRIENPYLGGRELRDARDIPAHAHALHASVVGYVQYIDVEELSQCAAKHDGEVFVTAVPGTLVDPSRPLAWLLHIDDEQTKDAMRNAFTIDAERSFDQDPRFGLCVLGEIASRALSPAMNDAGTAIDVIGRSVRLLARWLERSDAVSPDDVPCPRIRVAPLRIGDMFDDVFAPIARDGARLLEVQIRLQKAFRTLATIGDARFAEQAVRHARLALVRAEAALSLDEEKEVLREIVAATVQRASEARP